MTYLWFTRRSEEEDEPTEVYVELKEDRTENRRVEFFLGGLCFSYGEERGQEEVLSKEPYPENIYSLNTDDVEVKPIPPNFFREIWNQAQERPDGFMSLFV